MGLEPTTLSFEVWCSTDWTNQACWKLCYLNGRYTYMYFRYQCIHWFKLENDEAERILTCKCTVLWSALEYMYIVQIAKKHTSHLLASNMHIPNEVECLVVFAWCWSGKSNLTECLTESENTEDSVLLRQYFWVLTNVFALHCKNYTHRYSFHDIWDEHSQCSSQMTWTTKVLYLFPGR